MVRPPATIGAHSRLAPALEQLRSRSSLSDAGKSAGRRGNSAGTEHHNRDWRIAGRLPPGCAEVNPALQQVSSRVAIDCSTTMPRPRPLFLSLNPFSITIKGTPSLASCFGDFTADAA